jgi:hypothetical protein
LESRCFQTILKQRYAQKCCQSPYSSRTYAHHFLVSPFSTSCSVITAANARPLILVSTQFQERVSVIFISLAAIASIHHVSDFHHKRSRNDPGRHHSTQRSEHGSRAHRTEPVCVLHNITASSESSEKDFKRRREHVHSAPTCRSLRDARSTTYCSSSVVFVAQDTNDPLLAVRS